MFCPVETVQCGSKWPHQVIPQPFGRNFSEALGSISVDILAQGKRIELPMTAHSFLSTLGQAWVFFTREKAKGLRSPLEVQPFVHLIISSFPWRFRNLETAQFHVPIFVQENTLEVYL